jgi:hypothetical protein
VLPFDNDSEKAASAEIFAQYWQKAEADEIYQVLKIFWRKTFG